MLRKSVFLLAIAAISLSGCVVVDDIPPAPLNYPAFYPEHYYFYSRPLHNHPHPIYGHGPAEHNASKRPSKPTNTTPHKPASGIPRGVSKRTPPPTVR